MITRDFTVTGAPDLEVHAPSASVVLDRGPAGGVTVHVESKHPDDWVIDQHGDTISVRDERGGWRTRGSARVRVVTPDGATVRITTASGDVTATVATGRTTITTASGDVRVGVSSALTVKTASGDVTIDRVADDVTAKTASGDIHATAVGGGLDAATASGDVRVEHVGGDVHVNTASGDVRIGRFEGTELTANTVSGDVLVGVPSGRSAHLDVKTLTGRVRLPDAAPKTRDDGAARPQVDIRVKSVSGDFRLERA